MEVDIKWKEEQPLLSRTELRAEIIFEKATPSLLELKKKISELIKVNEELVMVTSVYTSYGHAKAELTAHIYKNKKDLEKIEPTYVIKRNSPQPKKEKPKAEKGEEKPALEGEKTEEEKPAEAKEGKKEEKPSDVGESEPKADVGKEEAPEEKKAEEEKKEEVKEEKPEEEKKEG